MNNEFQQLHAFWDTQPVSKGVEEGPEGPLESKKVDQIRAQPYPLPPDFEWCAVDLNDVDQCQAVYTLLTHNYVEDDEAMFRFDYSGDFLRWAMQPPGFVMDWHIGVRVKATQKLVAFVSGVPAHLNVRSKQFRWVEINFLCVHKKLRSKRLAPVLIREVTRRVNLKGIFQAVYTAGITLPTPICGSRYYHRSLNPSKLIDVGFSQLPPNMTIQRLSKLFKLPEEPLLPTFRLMRDNDCAQVHKLLNNYLQKYVVAPYFTKEDIRHYFLSREKIVYSYVTEDPETHRINSFVSFYCLPSSVINHPKHSHVNAAYLYYYVPYSAEGVSVQDGTKRLVKDAMILAHRLGFDVFNCLDLMDNVGFLEDLRFGRGDGVLKYYLFNYRLNSIAPDALGLVLH